jgi:hypothetical protein
MPSSSASTGSDQVQVMSDQGREIRGGLVDRPQGEDGRVTSVGIVACISHPLPELRTVLRSIRDTVPAEAAVAVIAVDLDDENATYLLRQYLRGRIQALEFAHADPGGRHCSLSRASKLVSGDYIALVDDSFEFKPGWLDKTIAALEADPTLGCLSLVPPSEYRRGRGRPRTINVEPVEVDRLDMRSFVLSRELVERHEREHMDERPEGCTLQEVLLAEGRRLAFLPAQVTPLRTVDVPPDYGVWTLEDGLPPHEGASGALQRLHQAYQLGDDILLTCLSCGGTELETIAARIRFCERHQVAIGFWYELRCPECGELLYKDDYQFRCPED